MVLSGKYCTLLPLGTGIALRPSRLGSVFTPELAICSKCAGEKKISGVKYSFYLLLISSISCITSTAKTHISVLGAFHPTFWVNTIYPCLGADNKTIIPTLWVWHRLLSVPGAGVPRRKHCTIFSLYTIYNIKASND